MKVILFSQPSCRPCAALKPHITAACQQLDIELHEWDITEPYRWTQALDYNVRSTPTLLVMDDTGQVLTRLVETSTLRLMKEIAQCLELHAPGA